MGDDAETLTVYRQKAASLVLEMEGAFRRNATNGTAVEQEVANMRQATSMQVAGELDYGARLFRRVTETLMMGGGGGALGGAAGAGGAAGGAKGLAGKLAGKLGVGESLYEDADQMGGLQAAKTPRFILRCVQWFFALLAWAVMASVPRINDGKVTGNDLITKSCSFGTPNDDDKADISFDFSPYRYVVAIGVFVWLYCTGVIIYYLLPVSPNGVKYLPGAQSSAAATSGLVCCRQNLKLIQLIADSLLLFLGGIACLAAAVTLEKAEESGSKNYFTLSTYCTSLDKAKCFKSGDDNPVPQIRASVAMMFFIIFLFAFSVQIAYRAWKMEKEYGRQSVTFDSAKMGSVGGYSESTTAVQTRNYGADPAMQVNPDMYSADVNDGGYADDGAAGQGGVEAGGGGGYDYDATYGGATYGAAPPPPNSNPFGDQQGGNDENMPEAV